MATACTAKQPPCSVANEDSRMYLFIPTATTLNYNTFGVYNKSTNNVKQSNFPSVKTVITTALNISQYALYLDSMQDKHRAFAIIRSLKNSRRVISVNTKRYCMYAICMDPCTEYNIQQTVCISACFMYKPYMHLHEVFTNYPFIEAHVRHEIKPVRLIYPFNIENVRMPTTIPINSYIAVGLKFYANWSLNFLRTCIHI